MSVFKVVEIFDSIDGEGKRAGMPVSFVRLAGCNLRCGYCDTSYALFGESEPCSYTNMSADEILSSINPAYRRVTLTGGEPLIHPHVSQLVDLMCENGCEVNIETNGAVDINAFADTISHRGSVFFTIDFKAPSSGESDKMIFSNYTALCGRDVIKFVVSDSADIDACKELLTRIAPFYKDSPPLIYIGTVYGKMDNAELCGIILREPLFKDAHMQLQLQKYIWPPDKKGV